MPAVITKPYYAEARHQFENETKEHELTILRDDGLYRHLRCAKPGTAMWSWNIITWPGYLTIVGDVGDGYIFRRENDMFTWFGGWEAEPYRINPQYWAEKMPQTIRRRRFSEKKFAARVREAASEYADDEGFDAPARELLMVEIEELIESQWDDNNLAHENVSEFTFEGERIFTDTFEWDFTDWDHHFLLACFAICWAIEKYNDAKDRT